MSRPEPSRPEELSDDKARAVLDARARALARAPSDEAAGTDVECIVTVVGDQRVALPVHRARQAEPPGRLSRLPDAGAALLGVCATANGLVAVADLAVLLGVGAASSPQDRWLVVLDDAVAPLGLLVDDVTGLLRVAAAEFDHHGPGSLAPSALVSGVIDGVLLLDADAVLADERAWRDPPRTTAAGSSQAAEGGP